MKGTCKSVSNFCASFAYSVENALNVVESLKAMSLQKGQIQLKKIFQEGKYARKFKRPGESNDRVSVWVHTTRRAHKLRLPRSRGRG